MTEYRAPGFILEGEPEGGTLVVTGPWTPEAEAVLEGGAASGLTLNYARGFVERDLGFVKAWPIQRLVILDRGLVDLTPIGRLARTLEELRVHAAPKAKVSLTGLDRLMSLSADWPAYGKPCRARSTSDF
jgi:hypothetical protein